MKRSFDLEKRNNQCSFEGTEFRKDTENSKRSGDNAGGVPPVPTPNTEVKTSRAEGTWIAGSWESKSLPGKQSEETV